MEIAGAIFARGLSPVVGIAAGGIQDGSPRPSHRLHYGHIVDPETKRVIDEVLLSTMHAPGTYTREDVVEINAHGGPVALREILELVIRQGARVAEPGEFTRRAFLNGRIDLTQAEATIDLINARSRKALEIAAAHMNGDLRRRIEALRERLLEFLTRIDAAIDFPDDVPEVVSPDGPGRALEEEVLSVVVSLIEQYDCGHHYRDGLRIAVVGRPNVGKSSLVNRLLCKDRIIVSEVPGTTRDTIEESISIDGLSAVITDTAGLHASEDPLEALGMSRTGKLIEQSDLILFIIEAGGLLSVDDEAIYRQIKGREAIVVCNKVDLVDADWLPSLPCAWEHLETVSVSALHNRGIERLKAAIVRTCERAFPFDEESRIVPNLRQAAALESARESVATAIKGMDCGLPWELIALDLQEAIAATDDILGLALREDTLARIFGEFCVGK